MLVILCQSRDQAPQYIAPSSDRSRREVCPLYTVLQPYPGQTQSAGPLSLPQWLNATETSMLGSCAANATCADLYNAFTDSAADSALDAYILAAINDIASVLPTDGNKTWDPSTSLAHAFSTFTTMATSGSELFGVHNGFALSAKLNPNVTESQLEAAFDLTVYLSGGASMVETVLKRIAFRFYNHAGSGTLSSYIPAAATIRKSTAKTLSRMCFTPTRLSSTSVRPSVFSSTSQVRSNSFVTSASSSASSRGSTNGVAKSSIVSRSSSTRSSGILLDQPTSSSRITSKRSMSSRIIKARSTAPADEDIVRATTEDAPNRKFADLKKIALLCGPDREVVKGLKMENYPDLISTVPLDLGSGMHTIGKDLSSLGKRDCDATAHIDYIQNSLRDISIGCSLGGIGNSVINLATAAKMTGLSSNVEIMLQAGTTSLDAFSIEVSAASILCTAGLPCYPSTFMWKLDQIGTTLDVIGLAIELASSAGEYEIAINVACMGVGFASDAYAAAKACCAKSCGSPSCMAAAIACSYLGLGC
jgi:hypothetical protein